jgi:TatD DNase family protein
MRSPGTGGLEHRQKLSMKLIDTHCHLFMDPLSRDIEGVLARASEAGVEEVVVPAFDLESWDTVRELGNRAGLHYAIGLHPWVANQVTTRDAPSAVSTRGINPGMFYRIRPNPFSPANTFEPLTLTEFRDRLAAALTESQAVAIGEIGLDFTIEKPTAAGQLAVLACQLELAADFDLPVILHCRNGWEMLIAALQPFAGRIRGVLHAYIRHPELAVPLLKVGFYVGFGGGITQPRAERARRSAEALPLDRILLETNAPLTGLDGIDPEQTEPQHVRHVAETLAGIRSTTVDEIADVITNNTHEFFRV